MSADENSTAGSPAITWSMYKEYKVSKDVRKFFQVLGYKDLNGKQFQSQIEPIMDQAVNKTQTSSDMDRHISLRRALCFWRVEGINTLYRLEPMMDYGFKDPSDFYLEVDLSIIADIYCAVGFCNSGRNDMPGTTVEAQEYGVQKNSRNGIKVRPQPLALAPFSGSFTDWPTWKPIALAKMLASGHYSVATDILDATNNPDVDSQLYGMLSLVLLQNGCSAGWLLDASNEDIQMERFSGHKLWKRIEKNYETAAFLDACLIQENTYQTSLKMSNWSELQPYLDAWVATRNRSMNAYRIQKANKWGTYEQPNSAFYFVKTMVAGILGPSDLKIKVSIEYKKEDSTWASVMQVIHEQYLESEEGKKKISFMHGKNPPKNDKSKQTNQEKTPPHQKKVESNEKSFSTKQVMDLFHKASNGTATSEMQIEMANKLKADIYPGSSNRQKKKEDYKRARFDNKPPKKRRKKGKKAPPAEEKGRGDFSNIRPGDETSVNFFRNLLDAKNPNDNSG
jgi:hypothetical protein